MEKTITDIFTTEELSKEIHLEAFFGPNLIFDNNLVITNFKGRICGVAVIQKDDTDKVNVYSLYTRNHNSIYEHFQYLREYIEEKKPTAPKINDLNLYALYGFLTSNGYFLTRLQACELGIQNGQIVRITTPAYIKSYSIDTWEKCPYPSSMFEFKL